MTSSALTRPGGVAGPDQLGLRVEGVARCHHLVGAKLLAGREVEPPVLAGFALGSDEVAQGVDEAVGVLGPVREGDERHDAAMVGEFDGRHAPVRLVGCGSGALLARHRAPSGGGNRPAAKPTLWFAHRVRASCS
jgi:hypothetical protein